MKMKVKVKKESFKDYEYQILYKRIFDKQAYTILEALALRHPEFMHDPEVCLLYIFECLWEEIEDRLSEEEFFVWSRSAYYCVLSDKIRYWKKFQPYILEKIKENIIKEFEIEAEDWANPLNEEE